MIEFDQTFAPMMIVKFLEDSERVRRLFQNPFSLMASSDAS